MLVKRIVEYHRTQPAMAQKYSYEDMDRATPWLGDDRMDEFLNNWVRVTGNVAFELPKELLLETFLKRIQQSKDVLKIDITLFDRMELDDPQRNIDHLIRRMQAVISLRQMERNREAQRRNLNGTDPGIRGGTTGTAALAPKSGARGRQQSRRADRNKNRKPNNGNRSRSTSRAAPAEHI